MDATMPTYEGFLEPWQVDLVTVRAKQMGFAAHELPDLLQRLAMPLRRFRFDPARSNGAKESTAVQALVDTCLRFFRRTESRYRAHVEAASLKAEPTCHADEEHLIIDVRQAVAALPERDQAICRHVGAGRSRNEIARRLHCGWHTVDRAMRRIAQHFRALGLDGWVRQ